MASNNAMKGKITFKIEKFSKMTNEYQFSPIITIGQHEWMLSAGFVEETQERIEHFCVVCYCNAFNEESTWMIRAIQSLWIVREDRKYHLKERVQRQYGKDYQKAHFSIIKSSIPEECIVDDTLTLKAVIEVVQKVCPSVFFGSPVYDQAKNYQQLKEQQDFWFLLQQ